MTGPGVPAASDNGSDDAPAAIGRLTGVERVAQPAIGGDPLAGRWRARGIEMGEATVRAGRMRIVRLLLLATLLCAGTLGGVRTVVTPARAASAAPAIAPGASPGPSCGPALFSRRENGADCQVRAMDATTLPAGFSESVVFGGLEGPTSVRFAPDGRIFVAEKQGIVKVFANLTATTPAIVVDLRPKVMDYYDRGLLSIALDPNFPATPDLYALYTYDAPIGGSAPTWNDACDDPFAATTEGCVVSGRLSRFRLSGNTAGPEQVLIEAWCQQFPSHSVGDLAFGPDGALYVSVGEGANYNGVDAGQYGVPNPNPCGDPAQEGGALRAQDARTNPNGQNGDPLGYSGSVLRVNPANPADRRIVAYGFRNPFRFTTRANTNELWIGNVGWDRWETINRVRDMTSTTPTNFGWPCYEGGNASPARQPAYEAANLPICNDLYASGGAVAASYFGYSHSQAVVAGDGCSGAEGSSVTGLAFYSGGNYPASYAGTLFFADYARQCIWAMPRGANGDPDPSKVFVFAKGASVPIDLELGPGGDLFYVDIYGGTIRRIRYLTPIAAISASATEGLAPLTVNFDGRGSVDQAGGTLTYAWDLNGNGIYGDGTGATAQYTYGVGVYTVGLQVKNAQGITDTKTITISVGAPPIARIDTPAAGASWQVGTVFTFGGGGTSPRDGALPPSALTWTLVLYHCPSGLACHTHTLQRFEGMAGGTFTAPDHEYPSYLELRLTVRDSAGLTNTQALRLDPQTVNLNVTSDPPGQPVTVNAAGGVTPFTRTVIKGSSNTLSPPAQAPYDSPRFVGWAVDGQDAGWANPLVVTVDGDRFVKAIFNPLPRYSDVPLEHPDYNAISELSARGIIHGYGDTTFGPNDTIRRAQMAALIVRAMPGWGGESWPAPFPDQGYVDNELWGAVGVLNHYDVARGYQDGTYVPTGEVLYVQSVSFIARAMVAKGYWTEQPDDPNLYPNVPAGTGHRADLATYVHYAGAIPSNPTDQPFGTWDQFATRAWFSEALWQALDSYNKVDRVR